MKAKIIEIFKSIQGEGQFAGEKQVFVRFFECNMHCHWCDTPHSIGDTIRNYKEMTVIEVINEINNLKHGCETVSLTGGEPLLQKDFIKALATQIKKLNLNVHIDTNGICFEQLKDVILDVDCIAMDIKLPSSTQCEPYWEEHTKFLAYAKAKKVFVKVVVTSDTKSEDMKRSIEIVKDVHPDSLFIIQPNTYELGNGVMKRCLEFYDYSVNELKHVRILPQVHKMLKVR